jgi:hypothetical protein
MKAFESKICMYEHLGIDSFSCFGPEKFLRTKIYACTNYSQSLYFNIDILETSNIRWSNSYVINIEKLQIFRPSKDDILNKHVKVPFIVTGSYNRAVRSFYMAEMMANCDSCFVIFLDMGDCKSGLGTDGSFYRCPPSPIIF